MGTQNDDQRWQSQDQVLAGDTEAQHGSNRSSQSRRLNGAEIDSERRYDEYAGAEQSRIRLESGRRDEKVHGYLS